MGVLPGLTYGYLHGQGRQEEWHCIHTRGSPQKALREELAWSLFEAREAIAKLSYEVCALWLLEDVQLVLDYIVYWERHTRWSRRTRRLRPIYEL